MNNIQKYSLLCILLLLGGCTIKTDKEADIIRINKSIADSLVISDLMDNVKYIAIHDLDSVVIGDPQKALLHDGMIYIADDKGIFRITQDGRYVKSLHRYGRGPGEYLGILDFVVSGNYIFLLDNNRKIIKYTLSGEYMLSSVLDFFPASLYVLDVNTILVTSAYQSKVDKFHLLDADDFSEISSFQEVNESELSWRHIRGQSNFYKYKQSALFHEPMNDVVYLVDKEEFTPLLKFDLYGRNAPKSFWSRKYNSVYDINVIAVKKKYCFGTPIYAESDNNIFFSYRDADDYLVCLYSKITGQSNQSGNIAFPELKIRCDLEDLTFCLYNESDQIILLPSFRLNRSIKKDKLHVNEDYDNPVICIGQMK